VADGKRGLVKASCGMPEAQFALMLDAMKKVSALEKTGQKADQAIVATYRGRLRRSRIDGGCTAAAFAEKLGKSPIKLK
jgi:hypothetical protein